MPLSLNLGTLTYWNPLGHSRPVTGLIYLFLCLLETLLGCSAWLSTKEKNMLAIAFGEFKLQRWIIVSKWASEPAGNAVFEALTVVLLRTQLLWCLGLSTKEQSHTRTLRSGWAYLLNWYYWATLKFWCRNYFLILAHTVYKMWIIEEPNKLELWDKLHFKEKKKTDSIHHVQNIRDLYLLNKYRKCNFGGLRCGTSTIVDVRRLKVKHRNS